MQKYGFSRTRIIPHKNRIYYSVLIRENILLCPYTGEYIIVSLYGRIKASENPYSRIFYTVLTGAGSQVMSKLLLNDLAVFPQRVPFNNSSVCSFKRVKPVFKGITTRIDSQSYTTCINKTKMSDLHLIYKQKLDFQVNRDRK